MPIHNMNFEGGIFTVKTVGYLDNIDARMWGNALKKYAKKSDTTIVAIVDMRQVERICPTVLKVVGGLVQQPNLRGIAIITSDSMASRNVSVMNKLQGTDGVRLFSTIEQAHAHAQTYLDPTIGQAAFYAYNVASA
jgi:anti-anti-sigma regulatory factor